MDCSLPGSSVHGILEARILEWGAISFSRDLPDPGIEPESPALQAVGPAKNEIKCTECPKTYIKNWLWCCHFFSFTAELLNMPNTHTHTHTNYKHSQLQEEKDECESPHRGFMGAGEVGSDWFGKSGRNFCESELQYNGCQLQGGFKTHHEQGITIRKLWSRLMWP